GSAWDIAFSRDPEQRFMFLADGQNNRVRIIVRETLDEVTAFGDGGRQPGQFYGVHSIATDSKGNVYTTETWEGKRLQKFVYKATGMVMAPIRGVLWQRRCLRFWPTGADGHRAFFCGVITAPASFDALLASP